MGPRGLPGLSVAIGIYLPRASLTPIFLGGIVRRVVEARRTGDAPESDPGVLAASGMIAGEGLVGVAIAGVVAARRTWPDTSLSEALAQMHFGERGFSHLTGPFATLLAVLAALALCAMLYRAGRAATR